MSAFDETIPSEVTPRQASENVRRHTQESRPASLLRWAWCTVPLHLLLGFGFWWLMQHQPERLAPVLLWLHGGFPVVLLLTARWWWNRWGELLALLLINHMATFGVLVCLPWS